MPISLGKTLFAVSALSAALCFVATSGRAAEHGEPPADEKSTQPAPPVVYKPGKPLNGRFDLTVLRSAQRVGAYRFEMPQIQTILSRPDAPPVFLRIKICVEFGSEAGRSCNGRKRR
jgi:hypothetical protein